MKSGEGELSSRDRTREIWPAKKTSCSRVGINAIETTYVYTCKVKKLSTTRQGSEEAHRQRAVS
jgi:hypothetical protein